MLLLRSETLPEGPEWTFELKLDGYRALAIKTGGKVQIRSRNDNDFTNRYPRVAKALTALPDETVIDGELVAFDASGRPSFNTLQGIALPGLAYYHQTGMNSHARTDGCRRGQLGKGLRDFQPRAYGTHRIIFVSPWPTEIHHQAIAPILSDMPVVPRDDPATGTLIGFHEIAQLFGIETLRECGRSDHVAEHDGKLPAFGFSADGLSGRLWDRVDRGRCRLPTF